MSSRDRIIISIALAACACVIGYWALLRPTIGRLGRSKQTLVNMQEDLANAVRLRRTGVEETLHESGMWTAEESSFFLRELAKLAAAHGTRLVSVNMADPRRLNQAQQDGASAIDYGLFEMKVSAKFDGSYPAVRSLIGALHEHEPVLQLTEVSLATGQGDSDIIAATAELKYFVFQRAVGSKPAAVVYAPEVGPVAEDFPVTTAGPSPFRRGPLLIEREEPGEGPGGFIPVGIPGLLPDIGGMEDLLPEEPPAPPAPIPVLMGIVGREGNLLAAISIEDRTGLYQAGDKLLGNATVARVAPEGVQITLATKAGERTILARTGQPIIGIEMPVAESSPEPGAGAEEETGPALPMAAGTVNGPAGAVSLIREEGRTYVARVGDVIGGGLEIVAIERGDVYVSDPEPGERAKNARIALPREGE
jgi:hypothetical protein